MQTRREQHKLITTYKVLNNLAPPYLCNILATQRATDRVYSARRPHDLVPFHCDLEKYKSSFFPSVVGLWNRQSENSKNAESLASFKHVLLETYIPPRPPSYYTSGPRYFSVLLTRLRLNHSQLNENLYRVGLMDSPGCACGHEYETVLHYLLECPLYADHRAKLVNQLETVLPEHSNHICNIMLLNKKHAVKLLVQGSSSFTDQENTSLLQQVTAYIADSNRFA